MACSNLTAFLSKSAMVPLHSLLAFEGSLQPVDGKHLSADQAHVIADQEDIAE